MARDTTNALIFGQNVSDYERGRPSYPDAAVDWMLAQCTPGRTSDGAEAAVGVAEGAEPNSMQPLSAVDVGAGTGKFTASLVARGLNGRGGEPDDPMRASAP